MPTEAEQRPVEKSGYCWSIPAYLLDYIHEQAVKRQITESEVMTECVWYHRENAGT